MKYTKEEIEEAIKVLLRKKEETEIQIEVHKEVLKWMSEAESNT